MGWVGRGGWGTVVPAVLAHFLSLLRLPMARPTGLRCLVAAPQERSGEHALAELDAAAREAGDAARPAGLGEAVVLSVVLVGEP